MNPNIHFRDRQDAGEQLAERLTRYGVASPIVLGLPRGGVLVGYEVARQLGAPLDVCIVRKVGAPGHAERGIGAVAEQNVYYIDREAVTALGLSEAQVSAFIETKEAEVAQQVRELRRGDSPLDLRNKTVIVVDDGVATGGTARAALQTVRARGAAHIVLAVPVASSQSLTELAPFADEIVCLHALDALFAVGHWYSDFTAATDADVIELLDRARAERGDTARRKSERVRVSRAHAIRLPLGDRWLEGYLSIPHAARGLVLFAHGTGSGRHSPRNQYVAAALQREGLATLLLDLLTSEEDALDAQSGRLRFDVELLASRLVIATRWAHAQPELELLPLGYFGASSGAAAALVAAATIPDVVRAVVSRGGRPDLAASYLGDVKAPTLLIVGGADADVLQLNREALYFLECEKLVEVVPGATHLFEEPGALEHVVQAAATWFDRYLGARSLEATA